MKARLDVYIETKVTSFFISKFIDVNENFYSHGNKVDTRVDWLDDLEQTLPVRMVDYKPKENMIFLTSVKAERAPVEEQDFLNWTKGFRKSGWEIDLDTIRLKNDIEEYNKKTKNNTNNDKIDFVSTLISFGFILPRNFLLQPSIHGGLK